MRRAVEADAPRIAEIHVRTWRVAYRGQLPDDFLDGLDATVGQRLTTWRNAITRPMSPTHEVWVAEVEGELAGFAAIGPPQDRDVGPGVGELYAIYVDPRFWDRGAGRALFEKATAQLRAQGHAAAVLWVLASNGRARRFYEAGGWRADGAVKTDTRPGGVELHEVRYRIEFAPARARA